jgi:hypothetical protein
MTLEDPLRKLCAAGLGVYPRKLAASLTRSFIRKLTSGWLLNALETEETATPARVATSLIVAACFGTINISLPH